ncbi:MAG: TRAP transporter substrate-binding protein [Defluviitaleaceae bacterium]|nr:TRAP transporter substrate-binding protein [Defluviitaleaceae bacterium]
MKRISGAFAVLVFGLAWLVACGANEGTSGEVFTLSFAHNVGDVHPRGYMIQGFADLVYERSNGRLVIEVFSHAQFGSDYEVMAQIVEGTVDMTAILSANMSHIVPEIALFDLPYLFFSMEQAWDALQGGLGEQLSNLLARQGLVSLGYQTAGFRHLTNNVRPIYSVSDMDGLNIRVSQSHFLIAQFRAINAGGISIPWGELPAAFEAGLADGQENPLPTIISAGIYEMQNYLTISNHSFTVYPAIISARTYNSLPEDLRQILRDTFIEIDALQWAAIAEAFDEQLAYLYTTGISINYLSADAMQGFRDATQGVYDEFSLMPGGASLIIVAARYLE